MGFKSTAIAASCDRRAELLARATEVALYDITVLNVWHQPPPRNLSQQPKVAHACHSTYWLPPSLGLTPDLIPTLAGTTAGRTTFSGPCSASDLAFASASDLVT